MSVIIYYTFTIQIQVINDWIYSDKYALIRLNQCVHTLQNKQKRFSRIFVINSYAKKSNYNNIFNFPPNNYH